MWNRCRKTHRGPCYINKLPGTIIVHISKFVVSDFPHGLDPRWEYDDRNIPWAMLEDKPVAKNLTRLIHTFRSCQVYYRDLMKSLKLWYYLSKYAHSYLDVYSLLMGDRHSSNSFELRQILFTGMEDSYKNELRLTGNGCITWSEPGKRTNITRYHVGRFTTLLCNNHHTYGIQYDQVLFGENNQISILCQYPYPPDQISKIDICFDTLPLLDSSGVDIIFRSFSHFYWGRMIIFHKLNTFGRFKELINEKLGKKIFQLPDDEN